MQIKTHFTIIFVSMLAVSIPVMFIFNTAVLENFLIQDVDTVKLDLLDISVKKEYIMSAFVAVFSILISSVLFITLYGYIQKNVVKQIMKVQFSVSNILRGKTNYKLEIDGNDEMEQLARSFDLLRSSVKKKMELEHELHQSRSELENERLISIGLVAARLAHDIRNPLSIIKNSVEMMKLKLKDNTDEKLDKYFSLVSKSVLRISHQIEDVLDFVRETEIQTKEISLNEIITSVKSLIQIPATVTINKLENDALITCDQKKMEIVFANLLINSIQAMNEKGKISFRLTDLKNYFVIDVEDTGPGIPQELMHKIFDPLVTTKQTGTGLGLSSCKTIVEQHHGKITVTNNPTRFTIKLPKKQQTS
jgi:signal transduction histidine kinase